jgi:hypothetical protein
LKERAPRTELAGEAGDEHDVDEGRLEHREDLESRGVRAHTRMGDKDAGRRPTPWLLKTEDDVLGGNRGAAPELGELRAIQVRLDDEHAQ